MPKRGAILQFDNIHLSVKNSPILRSVSGRAQPGQLLALLGPSGSGKTTLLHVISGRLAELSFGTVTLDDSPLTKALRRKIALVLQDDLFFANLTLRETLQFTARLRLPSSMPYQAKVRRVNEIVDTLDLAKCLDTRIGDHMCRGLSGGERKRANIACELLTDPAVLILDEPTSGLDSTSSLNLTHTLQTYAQQAQKTIVMSIHQPSSQIFHLFNQLLLLAEGQVIYFGRADQALNYFASLGLFCMPNYNPADFLLDKAKGSVDEMTAIFEAAEQKLWSRIRLRSRGSQTPDWSGTHDSSRLEEQELSPAEYFRTGRRRYHSVPAGQRIRPQDLNVCHRSTPDGQSVGVPLPPPEENVEPVALPVCLPTVRSSLDEEEEEEEEEEKEEEEEEEEEEKEEEKGRERPAARRGRTSSEVIPSAPIGRRQRRHTLVTISGIVGGCNSAVVSELALAQPYTIPKPGGHGCSSHLNRSDRSCLAVITRSESPDKWPTTFADQLRTLTHRNFRQSRGVFLSKFLVIKNLALALVVGLLWFQISHDETRINDIRGLFFFGLVHWGFESMFLVMNTFPSERAIITKERQSGAYRLSAYYLSKMLSELPLLLIMPSVYFVITYWMAGLNSSALAFLASWCALLMNVVIGESIGLAISAYAPSIQEAVVIVSLFMLTTLMLGGFYIQELPYWLEWSSYLSYTFYFYTLQLQIEFGLSGEPVKCKESNSVFEDCNENVTYVDSVQVLDHIKLLPLSIQQLCGVLIAFLLGFRILGYLVLRFIRAPE